MPGNLKFDLFHKVKMVPKGGKSTDCDQNLISCSEGGQDWIHQHAKFQAIPSLCSLGNAQNPQFDRFHHVKMAPKEENQQTMSSSVPKLVRINQQAIVQAVPLMHFPEKSLETFSDGRMEMHILGISCPNFIGLVLGIVIG